MLDRSHQRVETRRHHPIGQPVYRRYLDQELLDRILRIAEAGQERERLVLVLFSPEATPSKNRVRARNVLSMASSGAGFV
jgi:hypothetical protein